jgi:hypothetical protein
MEFNREILREVPDSNAHPLGLALPLRGIIGEL